MRRRRGPGLALALAGSVAGLAVLLLALPGAVRAVLWHRESNPVLRGRLLAEELGCLACHRPHAGVEIPNPGSRWGSVPRFAAGNAMMYVSELSEIEELIRYGAPRSWLDDPAVVRRLEGQPLRMPAYGDRLSDAEIADLVAFAAAVEGVGLPGGEAAAAGRRLAREQGCLSCHGVEGSGGLPNPGALGGFIPGFAGGNFSDLVAGEEEFAEWVLDGTSSRLRANPLIRFFWRRQEIAMPAYRGRLDDGEIGELWRWVEAVRQGGTPASPTPP